MEFRDAVMSSQWMGGDAAGRIATWIRSYPGFQRGSPAPSLNAAGPSPRRISYNAIPIFSRPAHPVLPAGACAVKPGAAFALLQPPGV